MNTSAACAQEFYQGYYDLPPLDMEKNFDYKGNILEYKSYWPWSLFIAIVYLGLIRWGEEVMRSRPAYDLRGALLVWNTVLALFSIFATSRLLPEMVIVVRDHGLFSLMCEIGSMEHRQTIAVWVFLMGLSKIVELGDTAFVVMRKQKLIFLHWYHHISVMVFLAYTMVNVGAMCFPFMTINYIVHSFMYTYFALKALRVRIPRAVSMMVTSLQILQMMLGIYITLFVIWNRAKDPETCCAPDEAVMAATLMYGSYFVLFVKFFVDVYWRKKADQYFSKKIE